MDARLPPRRALALACAYVAGSALGFMWVWFPGFGLLILLTSPLTLFVFVGGSLVVGAASFRLAQARFVRASVLVALLGTIVVYCLAAWAIAAWAMGGRWRLNELENSIHVIPWSLAGLAFATLSPMLYVRWSRR